MVKTSKLSMAEFEKYCTAKNFCNYLYSTYKQSRDTLFNPMCLVGSFDKMVMYSDPKMIIFKSDRAKVNFGPVKFIIPCGSSEDSGEIFDIVCKCFETSNQEMTYRIVAFAENKNIF